jgi:serine/threonine protein kinase
VEGPIPDPKSEVAFAGRYRIIEFLGEGDRKRTYLALDTNLERTVALSLVKPEAAQSDPGGTKREVDILCQVGSHDNIVTLYDSGIFDGTEYLVLEFLPGGTLRDYLTKAGRHRAIPIADVLRIGRQITRAVSHVHHRGVLHRDIAPANVWLDERQVAHLGDFDSAIKTGTPQDPQALPSTTEAYTAPEQVAGQYVDERSDLYSLGAVLYEMVTGRRSPRDSHLSTRPPASVRPGIPLELDTIIRSLLAERPDDRPKTADEVLAALKLADTTFARNEADASFTHNEDFLPWVDSLPFPLASILWAYHAELDSRAKTDYLLKFFEVLAQFTAAIQLSAFVSDRSFFDAQRPAWFGTNPDNPLPPSFRIASFGMWVNLSQRLAKTTRRLLSGEVRDAEFCYDLFAALDRDLIQILASKKLFEILMLASDYRNAWAGHGGVVGRAEEERRAAELAGLLARTRALIGTSFETWTLLKPGSASYQKGVFDLTYASLTGTRSIFRQQRVQIGQPLDSGRLYLLNSGNIKALELVPLIRIIAGQKTGEDAVYFYNRMLPDGVRWVSYHSQSEPEVVIEDPDIVEFLSDLRVPDADAAGIGDSS